MQSVLQWSGYATMAIFSLLLTFVLAGDVIHVSYWLITLGPRIPLPSKHSRQQLRPQEPRESP